MADFLVFDSSWRYLQNGVFCQPTKTQMEQWGAEEDERFEGYITAAATSSAVVFGGGLGTILLCSDSYSDSAVGKACNS